MKEIIKQLWAYRIFILYSISSEFKTRFIRSRLGPLWVVLKPLAQVLVYALILSNILSAKFNGINSKYAYSIYILSGTIAWTLFSEILSRCVTIFVDNGNLIKKLVFPKIVLPVIVVGVSLIDIMIFLLCICGIFFALGFIPGLNFFWLPLLMLVTIAFALGLGLLLGVLNVFIRDISQLMPIVLQFWFWFTPVVYMRSIIPSRLAIFLDLNPMSIIVESFQNVILMNHEPLFGPLAVVMIISVILLLFSLLIYKKAAPEMVDVL